MRSKGPLQSWTQVSIIPPTSANNTVARTEGGSLLLNLAASLDHSRVNGPGARSVLWVQGCPIHCTCCFNEFEGLLDSHDFHASMDHTVRRALRSALERGYSEEHVKAVLMVGGSSFIPCVQNTMRRIFGRERVMLDHPLDAIALGAAAFVAGVDFYDHIQHDYAIRHVDGESGSYRYHTIVKRGTAYPTQQPVHKLTVKATHEGQQQLGILIFEVGERRRAGRAMELVFDPSGAARIVEISPDEDERRSYFWMNENTTTFLKADPAASRGERRFEVEFNVDGNKRLTATARDLRTGKITMRDFPVVKLT